MAILAIIAALLLEQWRPLGDRKAVFAALAAWADWLERSFNSGEARHGMIAWLIAVLAPVAAALALYALLFWINPLAALLLNVAALYLTLGFRQFSHYFTGIQAALRDGDTDLARELLGAWRGEPATHRSREEVVRLAVEEGIAASHRHVFAVLFWFVLLPGPCGAILYRMAAFLQRRWGGKGAFGLFASRVLYLLEWPAARLTAAAFAVVGDFEETYNSCCRRPGDGPDPNLALCLPPVRAARWAGAGMPPPER